MLLWCLKSDYLKFEVVLQNSLSSHIWPMDCYKICGSKLLIVVIAGVHLKNMYNACLICVDSIGLINLFMYIISPCM